MKPNENMLLQMDASTHIGKTVESVVAIDDADYCAGSLIMTDGVRIRFTDGSQLLLKLDWRGRDCYISQYCTSEDE